MSKTKNGYVLPYLLFLLVIILNVFIFVILCRINEKKLYNDKTNYYHVLILENRARRHIITKITSGNASDFETELIYYDKDFIYYTYTLDEKTQVWKISLRIYHNNINAYMDVYYYLQTGTIQFVYR